MLIGSMNGFPLNPVISSHMGLGAVPPMTCSPPGLIRDLQTSLTALSEFVPGANPKGIDDKIGPNTLTAVAAAISAIGGELKKELEVIINAAIVVGALSDDVRRRAYSVICSQAKTLTAAVNVYVAKRKYGAAGTPTDSGGMLPTGMSPLTIGIIVAAGVAVVGGLYLILSTPKRPVASLPARTAATAQ